MTNNRRIIDSALFEDDFVGGLDFFGRYLWIGLFSAVADDQGRFLDNSAIIRARVFPYDAVTDDQVEAVLVQLAAAGKITRYQVEGKRLVQINHWWIYQQPSWASPSRHPAPEGWVDRVKYHTKGNKIVVLNWESEGGYVEGVPSPLSIQLPSQLYSPLPSALCSDLSSPIEEQEKEEEKIEDVKQEQEQKTRVPAPAAAARIGYQTDAMILRAWTMATDMPAIPPGDLSKVLPVLESVSARYKSAEEFAAALKPYYQAWLSRRTADGRAYSRTNLGWIDWFAVGEIPPVRGEKRKKQDQPSAAELAAALGGGV